MQYCQLVILKWDLRCVTIVRLFNPKILRIQIEFLIKLDTFLKIRESIMRKNIYKVLWMMGLSWMLMQQVFAALPEPLDPRVVANMTFEERQQKTKEIHEALKKATPEERKAFREKVHAKMLALSPEERKALHEKIHEQWKKLTPEQRKQVREERRAMIRAMSPEEREEMKKEREHMKHHWSEEERARWEKEMTK